MKIWEEKIKQRIKMSMIHYTHPVMAQSWFYVILQFLKYVYSKETLIWINAMYLANLEFKKWTYVKLKKIYRALTNIFSVREMLHTLPLPHSQMHTSWHGTKNSH